MRRPSTTATATRTRLTTTDPSRRDAPNNDERPHSRSGAGPSACSRRWLPVALDHVGAGPDGPLLDVVTGLRGVDHLAVTDVDADVVAADGDDVTGLGLGLGDRPPAGLLCAGGAGDADPGLTVDVLREAGAVEAARTGGAVDVRLAQLGTSRIGDLGTLGAA